MKKFFDHPLGCVTLIAIAAAIVSTVIFYLKTN